MWKNSQYEKIDKQRRKVIFTTVGGAVGLSATSVADTGESTDDDDDDDDSGDSNDDGPDMDAVVGDIEETVDAITDDVFAEAITNIEFAGVGEQMAVFDEEIQDFPHQGDRFSVLSSGLAEEAPGDPDFFASTNLTDFDGFRHIPNYSPDPDNNYDAFCVADIRIDFQIPSDVEGVAFDWRFGTEESPDFLGSGFQDFFEALLFTPDGNVRNIGTLPEGEPVTVDNADKYANTPEGSSNDPEEPLPDPPDTVYNAVTELQTTEASVSSFQGQEARLVIRVADASDEIYDSAVFVDNLRFVGNIDDDEDDDFTAVESALEEHHQAVIDVFSEAVRQEARAEAEIYNEHGSEYTKPFLNYLGYRAGVLKESEVNDDVRDLLDETTNDIDSSAIEHAYKFYDELFDAASGEQEDEVADLFYQFFIGDHPDQDVVYEFDGHTLDEIVSQYEEDVFPTYKSEFIGMLEDGEYTSSEISDIASYIETQTAYIKQLEQIQKQDISDVIDTLADQEQVTGCDFGVELESTDDDVTPESGSVQPEAIITATTIAAAVVLKKTGAGAMVAKGASSAYGSIKATGAGQSISSFVGGSSIGAAASGVLNSKPVSVAINAAHHLLIPPTTAGLPIKEQILLLGKWSVKKVVFHQSIKAMISEGSAIAQKGLGLFSDGNEMEGDDVGPVETPEDILTIMEQDVTITDIGVSNINLTDILDESGFGNLPTGIHYVDGTFFGTESGELTIQNNGTETVIPVPNLTISAQNVPPTGQSVDTGYPVVVSDALPKVEPGESKTVTFEYAVPLSLFTSSYSIDATLERFDSQESTEFDAGAAAFEIPSFDVFSGEIADGQTIEEDYSPDQGTKTVTYDLEYEPAYNVDLHVYDSEGNHTGMNYSDNTIETEIPGSTHSGDDDGNLGHEWVTIEDVNPEEYTVALTAPDIGTIIQSEGTVQTEGEQPSREEAASQTVKLESSGESGAKMTTISTPKISTSESSSSVSSAFDVDSSEVPDLDGEVSVSIDTPVTTEAGDKASFDTTIREETEIDPIKDVSISISDLTSEDTSEYIPSDNVEVSADGFNVDAGGTKQLTIDVETSEEITPRTYQGTVSVSANDGETKTERTLTVVVVPEPPSEPVSEELTSPPKDPDGDGLYEDIDGDGQLTVDDVKMLFENLDSETVQKNSKAFSFAGDLESEEVTLADVQGLYQRLKESEQ